MPIYEYQCQKCGHEFEREQRIVEDPIKKCPSCKANKAKRLISKTSFVLKGSGWYNDLYSSAKPSGDAASSDSTSGDGASGDGESKGEPTGDTKKSDAKSDPKKSDAKGDSKKKGGKAKKSAA